MELVKMRFFVADSLEVAQKLLGTAPPAGRALEEDPLHLPPLLAPGREPALSQDALRTMAAMYLQSELEQAGLIPIVEALVDARYRLPLANAAAAQKLEDFAQRAHDFYNRGQREMFFARLFGVGRGATLQRNSAVNNPFQQLLAALCNSLLNYSTELGWAQRVSATAEASIRQTAIDIIMNLAPRQFGSTLIAGHTISDQLRRAIDILSDRDIQVYFRAHDMWDTVRKALGAQTPDLGRLVTRGQTGMQLLSWLANSIPALQDPTAPAPLARPGDPAFTWAAQWLDASGLMPPGARRVA